MQTREAFHSGLKGLKDSIIELGQQAEAAFITAIGALETNDEEKFNEIKANDRNINQLELAINEKATLLIAKQKPVASDLRKIIAAFKVSSDLERVGDLAVDICKAGARLPSSKVVQEKAMLIEMANLASKMLLKVLDAYAQENILEAQQIAHLDDQVDEMYAQFVKKLFTITDSSKIEHITQLAFISRYIERIADYATNIAELIIYEVNGQYFDLN